MHPAHTEMGLSCCWITASIVVFSILISRTYGESEETIGRNTSDYMQEHEGNAPTTSLTVRDNDGEEDRFRQVIHAIRMSFLPIMAIGTITNSLNVIVFSRPGMRRLSTSVYLLSLGLADLGVMFFELFRIWFEWMDKMVDPATYMSDTYCKLGNYLNVGCRDFSNWLVAAITVERMIVLAVPFKAKEFCTVFRARIVTVSLAVLIFGVHVHFLVFSAAVEDVGWVCWQVPTSEIAPIITAWIEFITGNTVVFFVLIINIVIVVLLLQQRDSKPHSTKDEHMDQTRKLTTMLLAIGVLFLVCELPRVIMAVISKYMVKTYTLRILMNLTFTISGINHSCNFFFYVLSGKKFRDEFLSLVNICKKKESEETSYRSSLNTSISNLSTLA